MNSLAILDDNRLLRLGLASALELGCGIELVGVFDLTDESISEIENLRPDLVLMGMRWPVMNRIGVCRRIRHSCPATRLLILATEVRDEEVLASVMAGASGYIAMNVPRSELVRAVHAVAGGGFHFESSTIDRMIGRLHEMNSLEDTERPDELTERELLILNMIAEGYGNEQIGQSLAISEKTVRNNITQLRTKLRLHSRAQLGAYAARWEMLHKLRLRSVE